MEEGVSRRRVGFISKGAPARQHSEIQTPEGETVRPTALQCPAALPHCAALLPCIPYVSGHPRICPICDVSPAALHS